MKKVFVLLLAFFLIPSIVNASVLISATEKDGEVIYNYVSNNRVMAYPPNSDPSLKLLEIKNDALIYGGGRKRITKQYPSIQFYKIKDIWYNVETSTTTKEAFNLSEFDEIDLIEEKSVMSFFARPVYSATTTTSYAVNDGDVTVKKTPAEAGNWNYLFATTTANKINDTDNRILVQSRYYDGTPDYYFLKRAFLRFNLSSIRSDASISTSSLFLYGKGEGNELGNTYSLYAPTTDCGSLDLTDYGLITSNRLSDDSFNIASWSTAGYNVYELNASGTQYLTDNIGDYVSISWREIEHDVGNTEPTLSVQNPYIEAYSSRETGTNKDPYLEITWYIPTTTPTTMNYETGNINMKVQYTEVYDLNGDLEGYEYTIVHNPAITYFIVVFSSFIFFFFIYQILRKGWKRKDKILN